MGHWPKGAKALDVHSVNPLVGGVNVHMDRQSDVCM
jgi:hypothetical protein